MTSTLNIGGYSRSTISRPAVMEGVGLHSGNVASVILSPGTEGIRVEDAGTFYPLSSIEIARTPRRTRLRLPSGRHIDMVEHLFAAMRIIGITDADVSFVGDEVPVLDGSSAPWLSEFSDAGIVGLAGPTECLVVTAPVAIEIGQSRYNVSPGAFHIDCTIDFPTPHIGFQSISAGEAELATLAEARTFAMEHEIAMLKANNLALGGSLENAVVVGESGPLNPEGFRMPDECVRHKALDFVGDLMVLGMPVIGRFEVHAPGHAANNAFVEAMIVSGALRKVSVASAHPMLQAA